MTMTHMPQSSREENYIICVDDEQSILNQLSTQLEEAFGDLCVVENAESAEEALEVIEDIQQAGGRVLLVISDQVMPGMKGDRFLEEVNEILPHAHKILLTGYAGLESAMYAINYAGLDRYIEKPWDKEEFLAVVRYLLGTTVETKVPVGTFRLRDALHNVLIFRDLPIGAIDLIIEKLKPIEFPKDTTIFRIDDPGDCMYIIKSGEVKVVAGTDDTGEVLAYLGRGNYFGEMALLTGEARSASVITVMDSELFMLTKEEFDFLLAKHPTIALSLSHVLSQRLRDISIKKAGRQNKIICTLNAIQKPREKLLIVDIARKIRKETNGRVVIIDLASTDPDLAALINLQHGTTGTRWIIDNLDNIQEQELTQLLPEDEEGVKFFTPSRQEVSLIASSLIPILSLLKEFYNFILVNFNAETTLDPMMVKTMEQANTILYLLEQTDKAFEQEITVLQKIHHEFPRLMKKIEVVAARYTPNYPVSELLYSLVEGHHIHYLRLNEQSLQFLVKKSPPAEGVARNHEIAPVNRDVSRIARRLGNVSVGLVLGGGGARAYAHLGILKVLQEEGIPIDIIAGTSMGAFIGALHVMGKSIDEIIEISRDNWRKLNSPISWSLPRIAFIKGKRIENMVHDIFGDTLIEDLPIPFFCVAGDLVSGQEVVLGQGKLYKAILATGALPGFFEPVAFENMYLVDGGVVNNVPGDVLKKQGIDIVIAVDVTPEREVHLIPAIDSATEIHREKNLARSLISYARQLKSRYWSILLPRIIMRVIAIEGLEITRNKSRYFDIHIKPNLEDFDLFDFRRLPEIVALGEQTGRQEIVKIRETINALKHEPGKSQEPPTRRSQTKS
ncbi:cyclic nucleotide-binding domain-containing protein [candidate division KSB3 bacterium]|uniref:Cyclic nucleotide-binding domain-containing protein n=1 Tax=candidate division KSB3 bacterium TaxID=2044937 RepID=A0A9D5Q645_9BACT|nr:cyclic nucleotide-binding domain-containing protein [candidate division KSB3 bacterium]MBD3325469.1 cyclic nucleotide-binding domain-containing protein [candidate division KSB3 bacterium]